MKRVILFSVIILISALPILSSGTHPITFDDFIKIKRISDPQISPDGKTIAFVITEMNKEENTSNSDIWLISNEGNLLRKLTSSPQADYRPRWSPNGKKIAFISTRNGSPQVWMINLKGGEAYQVTDISTGATGVIWSSDGKYLAFVSEVYPDCQNEECNKKREEEKKKNKVQAKVFDSLFFRHWNRWRDEKRSHLFIIPIEGGEARDLTPGKYDCPPIALGSAQDYTFSPDSQEICLVMNTDPMVAISTNNDLFTVPIIGGELKRITTNKATDNSPHYSPDGQYIAYRAMDRPGFEADKYSLMLYDRQTEQISNLTEDFDRSIGNIVWSPDSKYIYFSCQEKAYRPIYRISLKDKKIKKIIDKMTIRSFFLTPDRKNLIFEKEAINQPTEIFSYGLKKKNLKQITQVNKELLAQVEMNPLEEFWFEGAEGDMVHGLMLKPPFFDPSKKYPMVMLIHGGPQGAWEDEFHYRWNAQMFASPGYVVIMINFHGSTGYGQAFTDSISGDWGGKPFEDLMTGLTHVLAKYNFLDPNLKAAAGASYGGYMINWIAGHTDRFKCLISHAGVFDLRSKYGSTEELWFPEWEFKGTPWSNPEMYEKFSPSSYVQNFKTPCLVIHGQNDFRVPVTQGFQMFTSLQRMGVPSKLVYFPDETHFVQKPQNAELWWKIVHDWLAKYLKS
ncbi:MAG: prolyl oligopeptidase family serine peptidase [Candidatus Aminicenantia bacterium]